LLAIGAGGVVSVAANIVPRDILGLVQAYRDGNLADARARHLRLFPLCRDLLGLGPNPVPVKTAMALLGRGNGELRLPLCSLEEAPRETLRQALIRYGMM
jgi:4-hydroxy-tetrahydrodipicolinate synthase